MKRIIPFIIVTIGLVACTQSKVNKQNPENTSDSISWEYADSIFANIKEPVIPEDTFYISALVAEKSPEQIQNAIQIIAKKGGGTLVLKKGIYHSGPIVLRSNIELHLKQGAIVKFIPDTKLYPLTYTWFSGRSCMNFTSMIYARNVENVKISGMGIIDGQGNHSIWKNMKYTEKPDFELLKNLEANNIKTENRKFGEGHSLRPDMIALYECSRISISGVTLLNTPYFMIHPVMSEHVTLSNLKIKSKGYNQVGIAVESSQNVLLSRLEIQDIGEGIKLLAGREKNTKSTPTSNILIQNSEFENVTYTPLIFSSKSGKGINRVFISGLKMDNSEAGICLYGQQHMQIHDVWVKDVEADAIRGTFFYTRILRTKIETPIIYNINLDDIRVKNCGRAMVVLGHKLSPIENIHISNSSFACAKRAIVKNATQLKLSQVALKNEMISKSFEAGDIKIPKLNFDYPEDKILDTDDIQYSNLPLTVKHTLDASYAFVPIKDIDRVITSTNVIYDINLEFESFREVELMVQEDGEIVRSEFESNFEVLPDPVLRTIETFIKAKPSPYIFNTIKEIRLKDFTYFQVTGEFNQKLFALGISEDGTIIEEKQQSISNYLSLLN